MAKWGEGDPRWIVEERADAKNVNNWHWTEKNATAWSKTRITELLVGLVDENDKCKFEITSISKLEGEAVANNRKGKLIFFYEWDIEAEWNGFCKNNLDELFVGKINIPNLSEENSAKELDINVSIESSAPNAVLVKEFVRVVSAVKIREALGTYIDSLILEYGKDLLLPSKQQTSQPVNEMDCSSQSSDKKPHSTSKSVFHNTITTRSSANENVSYMNLELSEVFYCSPFDLYKVFTTMEAVRAFSRSSTMLDSKPNGNFSMFNGEVTGQFEELDESNLTLKFKWRKKKWPESIFSQVTLTFKAHSDGAQLFLTQQNVPNDDLDDTKLGWKMHYFNAIKQTFGYGQIIY